MGVNSKPPPSISQIQNHRENMDILTDSEIIGDSLGHLELQKPHSTLTWQTYKNRKFKTDQQENHVPPQQRHTRPYSLMKIPTSHIPLHTSLAPSTPTFPLYSGYIQCDNMIQEVINQDKDPGFWQNSIGKDHQGMTDPSSHPVWQIPTTPHYRCPSSQMN